MLKKADYVNVKPFSFLPGHKALLLGLKRKSEEFDVFLAQNEPMNEHSSINNVNRKAKDPPRTGDSGENTTDIAFHFKVIHFVEGYLNIDGRIVVEDAKNMKLDCGEHT